jgi:cobalt-zinc-cadmium efflux system protein
MEHCHTHNLGSNSPMGKAFALALIINLVFTITEAALALFSHSASLLADAGHNLGDVLGLALAWAAHYLQSKHPADRFSYGYKRTTILAAFFNAVLLISSAILIGVDAADHFFQPHSINEKIVFFVA